MNAEKNKDRKRRIGVVGYGHLGQYLCEMIERSENMEIAFVWNRTRKLLLNKFDVKLICENLNDISQYNPDVIVEVAHPCISQKYGKRFLETCDYMVGSPTALACQETEYCLRKSAGKHGLYVPAGALWGGHDIAKMADRKSLKALKITMKKHPSCFKLETPLKELNERVSSTSVTLYEGSVRNLCPLAPNNVNTMAAGAIAAHNLGFDNVIGCLVSDNSLTDWHIVEVEVLGQSINGNQFQVSTVRKNPAGIGAVTGTATYASFWSSLQRARGLGPGVHLC